MIQSWDEFINYKPTKWEAFKLWVRAHTTGAVSTAWYWLRTHTINRYHIVDCRSPQNGYRWGWMDRDALLLFASFNVLVDFIEGEKPFEVIDFEWDPNLQNAKKELQDLYQWWKSGRAAEYKANYEKMKDDWSNEERQAWHEENDALDAKDDLQLLRLLNVRRYMWT